MILIEKEKKCIYCGKKLRSKNIKKQFCSADCEGIYRVVYKMPEKHRKKKLPENMQNIANINEEARKAGMSYGQYVGIVLGRKKWQRKKQ